MQMQKPSRPGDGQLSLFQVPDANPALPREVSQKAVSLLARLLREHAGRAQDGQSEADDE